MENKETEKKRKDQKVTVDFSIKGCPMNVHNKFVCGVKGQYNDVYWVKLMDLMRKAEAYDAFVSGFNQGYEYEQEDMPEEIVTKTKAEPQENEKNTVKTFGGDQKVGRN